ncbi:MAG TPA: hypothetical protein DCZ94_07285 [Lentisphaeria bacterium]|nr:MAG: hypothetical protein A2X48_20435 [Lentisphaerae bacterium GWF2_49_21]HBC86739.1 hypothetical protein [Lentisphaeria bacterium]
MKKTIIFLSLMSFTLRLNALDVTTTDGTTYKDIQYLSVTSVGIRFYQDGKGDIAGSKSTFIGNVDLTEESKKAIKEYQEKQKAEEKAKKDKAFEDELKKEQLEAIKADAKRKAEIKPEDKPVFPIFQRNTNKTNDKEKGQTKKLEAIVPGAKDKTEDEIIKLVDKSKIPSGRISPTIEIGGYGKLDGKIIQTVNDDLILVNWGLDYIYAVKDPGIGKDKVDNQFVEIDIVRVGTYKYTSIAGVNKQVPLCRVVR